MERKFTYRQYHVQDNSDVELKDVRMYCNTNQFPELSFSGPHYKPHGTGGLSKHYHFRFDPKLGNGVDAICCISCVFVACTSILDKPWIYGIPSYKKERYKPVTECTYWPALGSFKNCNIIQLLQKSNPL